jgi:hypothetical protein
MNTKPTRKFVLVPTLCAAALGLGLMASGCYGGRGDGYGYGDVCAPELIVDWQIQNSAGAPVTCQGAGAATVRTTVDGYNYDKKCDLDLSYDSNEIPLQGTGTYDVSVSLYDDAGNSLAPAQASTIIVNGCGVTETSGPALLVVTPVSTTSSS